MKKSLSSIETLNDQEILRYHHAGRPGKIGTCATKPMATQRDLAIAYSPGVAVPVRLIAEDAERAYDYTNKGNMVAVISNGSAILGLGGLGPLAAKPVMEGKAVLFKRFAALDAIDLEIDTKDVDAFVQCVRYLSPAFGGINLEDIKAPDCFLIEAQLSELMDIPVFHDDQHGTAIITLAGLINAFHLTGRDFASAKIVINGAGSAGLACAGLLQAMGAKNLILCDRLGPIVKGRNEGLNQWKMPFVSSAKASTLAQAVEGADVFLGLSVKGALKSDMIASMAARPIIFALANPDPETTPAEVASVRADAIVATGRSDYPNQVNNVLGFPYIFRGALDVRAKAITQNMKIACARALAELAREDVPDEVAAAYGGERPQFGQDYIIPATFDPRLIHRIPPAVAQAAMEDGVARAAIIDMQSYRARLAGLQDPVAATLQAIYQNVRRNPRRVVFAEGEEQQVIRAALAFHSAGLGQPVLIGRQNAIARAISEAGLDAESMGVLAIEDPFASSKTSEYADFLYRKLQRRGLLRRDCLRLAQDRNIFSACKLALGYADAMLAGVTRSYAAALSDILKVIDPRPGRALIGVSMVLAQGRTVLVADTNVHDMPGPEEIADIAVEAARVARRLGYEPRLALLAYSTFGYPEGERSTCMRAATELLDQRQVDFEYDGEMAADVALNADAQKDYPFCRLSGPANVLIMPAIHSASISTKLLKELGGADVIGPMLCGLQQPAQIAKIGASASDLVNMAALAAFDLDQ